MIFLLDPGHGGTIFGHYFTPGKRSPEVPPGIYEGEFNRKVCSKIQRMINGDTGHVCYNLNPGPVNMPLKNRIKFVNKFAKAEKEIGVALISIHANAAGVPGWSNAHGSVVFMSRQASANSQLLANLAEKNMRDCVLGIKSRGIKQANFGIIMVKCPSILIECGFMTNMEEAILLNTDETQEEIAHAGVNTLMNYANEKI